LVVISVTTYLATLKMYSWISPLIVQYDSDTTMVGLFYYFMEVVVDSLFSQF